MSRLSTLMMTSTLLLGYESTHATPPQHDVPAVVVRFADLDLTHSDGVAVLYRRLTSAADTVCAAQNGRDLRSQTRYKLCRQSALSTAVGQVDQADLTAYYRAQLEHRNATIQLARH